MIGVCSRGKYLTLPFASIISIEIAENNSTVVKTNRAGQMAGTAIGAIALGGVCALIGGLSSSTSSKTKVNKVSINIISKDRENPFSEIRVYEGSDIDKNGIVYKQ
jgi:hypothetical protein